MSALETTPETSGGRSISLRYEMTAREGSAFTRQSLRRKRSVWIAALRKIAALGIGYLAIDFAISGKWLMAALLAYVAVSTWSEFMVWLWLMRVFMGEMTTQAELVLDCAGIRGEFKYRSGRSWGNDQKRVDYAWDRLREFERLPDYLILEFHGGGGAIIPVRAFATPDDLEQCEAWANAGLSAQQRSQVIAAAPA